MLGCAQNSYLIFFFSLLLLSVAAPLKPVDVDIRNLNSRVLNSQGPKKVFWHAKVTFIPNHKTSSQHRLPQKPQKVKNAIHMFLKIVLPGLDKSESVSSIRIKASDWEGVPDPSETAIQSETAKGGARYRYEQEFWIMLPPIEQEHEEKHYLGTISWDSDERRISGDIRDADDNTKVLVEVKDGVLSGPKHLVSLLNKKDKSGP